MHLRIDDRAPDFSAPSTQGPIDFHDWARGHWSILFSHPKDFTPVCSTELARLASLRDELEARDCRVLGLSVDSVDDHRRWCEEIAAAFGERIWFPLVADAELAVAKRFGMLPATADGVAAERSAADNATVRTVFIIGPDLRIKLMVAYPMSTGRSFDELLRVLDSVQLTAREQVATPAEWQPGEPVVIAPSVSEETAAARYPDGFDTVTPYLRLVSHGGR